ncbi:DUF4174 domain-containing protein [Aureimonas phyllosphaerae]|uniref:DUF4174 domain-containing protein n=1 Tax=Aureimonas phyllosphaerae TaxID=1166078 RepID=A0A7W6BMI7_9HYPH|nr:DUF4174 domain-containing protein [Aureimonas phyllosphaerae]MBB3934729.1 hypothetical protein [Aureimonas phyllosphaerae]MBB3958056.1 hypothetical protein [Aureimonas phyllosphaerae]
MAPILMASSIAASAASLDALRWESRVLLIVSSESGAAEAERQEAFLRGRDRDLSERQMTVIAVRGDEVRTLAGRSPTGLSAAALRRDAGLGDAPFVAVLIGLDGGVKWTSPTPASLDEINAVVDAMPMRRAGLDR